MSARAKGSATKRQSGFTLIEVMVVLVLMGLIAAAVAMNVRDVSGSAHQQAARIDFKSIADALEVYRVRHAKLPANLQDLVDDRELKRLPIDPWKQPYHFEPAQNPDGFRITTLGADNAAGGEGDASDLHSDDADAQ